MSGSPSETEIQTQWRNAVAILESLRAEFDTNQAGAGGLIDTLFQSLEGEYTPESVARWANGLRRGMSDLISPGAANSVISPVLLEYGKILSAGAAGTGFGSGYTNPTQIARSLYEWFHDTSKSVASRGITFDSTPTVTGSGNGTLVRCTQDENGYPMEACHVEKKMFRCRADENTGAVRFGEVFEALGQPRSFDSLLRGAYGSGDGENVLLTALHSGRGNGGSLLQNSSFSTFDATALFQGWQILSGSSANIDQDTTNYYRSHPNASLDASLELTGGASIGLRQPLDNWSIRRLDTRTPYYVRLMFNRAIGSANDGTLTLRLGSSSADVALSAQAGWNELAIALDGGDPWFKTFNAADLGLEIEWTGSTGGTLLIDDVIVAPMTLIDGTYYAITQRAASPVNWKADDIIEITDTGGAPGTGQIQWWLWVSGYGYLPTSGSPTFADPA